jgi:predicted permease
VLSESRRPDHRKLRELEILELVGWLAAGCWRPSGVSEFEEVGGKVVVHVSFPPLSFLVLASSREKLSQILIIKTIYFILTTVSLVTSLATTFDEKRTRHDTFRRRVLIFSGLWLNSNIYGIKINQFKFKLILFFFQIIVPPKIK